MIAAIVPAKQKLWPGENAWLRKCPSGGHGPVGTLFLSSTLPFSIACGSYFTRSRMLTHPEAIQAFLGIHLLFSFFELGLKIVSCNYCNSAFWAIAVKISASNHWRSPDGNKIRQWLGNKSLPVAVMTTPHRPVGVLIGVSGDSWVMRSPSLKLPAAQIA